MEKCLFSGSGVALVTPFRGDEVDYAALGGLIDWQIQSGTDALVVLGTTGEPSTMTLAEKEGVIAFSAERVAGRIPVIAGTGGNNTREAVHLSRRAQALGADGLLLVTPYYNKTTQEGLIQHYRAVADAVERPVILYNVPARTALNLLPETVALLAEHPNIRAVKEASADIDQITELVRLCGERICLYSGNDSHVVPVMALGARGVISVAANVVPRQMHEVVARFLAGDLEGSLRAQLSLNGLVKLLFSEVSPIPAKAALAMMGRLQEELRLPLVPMSEAGRSRLREELARRGLV